MDPDYQGVETNAAAGVGPRPGRHPWLKAYPKDVNWYAQLEAKTLQSLLEGAARKYGGRTCCYFLGKTFSYAKIDRLADRVAAGLQKYGVGKGVNVGLLMPNTPAFIIFYYGILKAGGTVVGFNPLLGGEELAYQAIDARLHTLVTFDLAALFRKAEALLADGSVPSAIVCPFAKFLTPWKAMLFKRARRDDVADWRASKHVDKLTSYGALIRNGRRPAPVTIDPANDIAVLQYTCGTTAMPKGAMLTHANLSINAQQTVLWIPGYSEGRESTLGILPFFHIFAMTTVMNVAIAKSASILLLPSPEVDQAVKLIRQLKPTAMPSLPTLFNAFLNSHELHPGDLSSLKYCVSGGAPLPVELKHQFEELTGSSIMEGYGLTEASPIVCGNPLSGIRKDGSVGMPLPGTRLSIRSLDDPAREMPLGEEGEICVAGPQVMKGYWQRPKETADAMTGEFLRTGDVGYMDAEGYTFIIDRSKDIIQCSGFNVYPRTIEDAIYHFPGVEEVSVIGIPDQYRGQAPKAFVKLKTGASATQEEILKFLMPKLTKVQMPSQIEFRDALPKTLIGKLSKKALRAEIKANG